MSSPSFPSGVAPSPAVQLDESLGPIVHWLESQEDGRERFRWALRDSLDELLDGQRRGRWAYQQLSKTEKTHLGTMVEVNLTKEFDIADGIDLDWLVADEDLDCKFSKDYGKWSIPMEMYLCADHGERQGKADHPALVVWMNDDLSQWAAGVVRVSDDRLRWTLDNKTQEFRRAYNRDNKRVLNEDGLAAIHWMWGGRQNDLPENTILHMDEATRSRVFAAGSGQRRVNQLFRDRQEQVITRATVMTVAQQDDGMKRARDARKPEHLGLEGVIVLGHQDAHPLIAAALGLPIPEKGEFVACPVALVPDGSDRAKFRAAGSWWDIARPGDEAFTAPVLPGKQPEEGWAAYLGIVSGDGSEPA
jgi:Restriction endonuclease NaeI